MKRVLVIEDDQSIRTTLLEALRDRGCDVITCPDADTGRAALRNLVLTDVAIVDYDLGPGQAKGTTLIDEYAGTAETILYSGLSRDVEIRDECPRRQPDRQWPKTKLPELIEYVSGREKPVGLEAIRMSAEDLGAEVLKWRSIAQALAAPEPDPAVGPEWQEWRDATTAALQAVHEDAAA